MSTRGRRLTPGEGAGLTRGNTSGYSLGRLLFGGGGGGEKAE